MRLTLSTVALSLMFIVCANSLAAQPPMTGYTNSPYSTGPYQGTLMACSNLTIKQGSSTLLTNASGAASSPFNTFYSAVSPAPMIPGAQHTIEVTMTGSGSQYPTYATAWIDYNNDGDFLDSGEYLGASPTSGAGTTVVITFTAPTAFGGVKRLRMRTNYSTPITSPTATGSYGEAEDYLVNLGFAINTGATLPTGAQGTFYQVDITATNGVSPYNWQFGGQGYIKSGALPAGLTAAPNGNALRISGTPTGQGNSNFTVEVWDSATPTVKTAVKAFSITIFPPPATLPFSDDFSTDKGWQIASPWSRQAAVAFSQASPPQSQPGTDHTASSSDNMILGDTIGSPYTYAINNSNIFWVVSPPFSGAGHTAVRLSFWGWLGKAIGAEAKVEATNNGTTWVNIWDAPSGSTLGGSATATWTSMFYDISAVCAGNAVCQVRIGIGPTAANPSTGWSIDDVLIEEPTSDLVVQEVGISGPVITDDQAVGGDRNFGVHGTSTAVPLTIYMTNNGPSPVTFAAPVISKSGANPGDFALGTSGLVNPLPPGQSCSFTITFYRTTVGVSTATIHVHHNAAYSGVTPFDINVMGEAAIPTRILQVNLGSATGPQISHQQAATGTPRDFMTWDINAGPTAPITIFVTNTGTSTLTVNSPYMGGAQWYEFNLNSATFTSNLTPGSSTSFEVAFDPTAIGTRVATVNLAHNGTTGATPFEIPVMGDGTSSGGATLVVHEGSATGPVLPYNDPAAGARNFGNQIVSAGPTAPLTITIQNSGGLALTPGTPVLGGTNPGEFQLNTTGFLTSVAPGANTSFQVMFDPTAVGVKLATVTFTHNDTAVTSPFIINLRGNGVTVAPAIVVRETDATGAALSNPASATGILDFGAWDVNAGPTAAATIYVENTGTAALTVNLPSFQTTQSDVQLQTTGFAGSIGIGQNATFTITFDPSVAGTKTAVVEFVHNDSAVGTPFVLNVTGLALLNSPRIEVREATTVGPMIASGDSAIGSGRDCGSVTVGGGATLPVSVIIMNTGNQPMTLGTPVLTGVNAGDFVLNLGNFNTNVPIGGYVQIDVSCDPVLGGMKDCEVEITHDDPGAVSPFVVRFIGTGIDPTGVLITTPDLPAGAPAVDYGPLALNAIQGAAPYTWSIYAGNLPPGLNLTAGGVVNGAPSGFGGTYPVIIRVQDASGATNEKTFNVVVSGQLSARGKADPNGCAVSGSGTNLTMALLAALGALVCGMRFMRRRA